MPTTVSKVEFIEVRIISPKGVVLEEKALAVSSKNSAGKFDILPEHANFITLVENSPINIRKIDDQIAIFNFPLAIVYNANNKVNIYTDIQLSLTS